MRGPHDIQKRPSPCGCSTGNGLRSALMNFHEITMTSITGEDVTFDAYAGKLVLVVNVASA